nr:ribonuclease H-like domain-containing protein [Tanacetum cinerariifolium]
MYPNVQDTLKLPVKEHVILEEHAISIGTIVSLPYLDKDFNFSDQFLNDKSSNANKEKTHAEAKVKSMVTVTIQQDTSSVPSMQFKVVDLPRPRPNDPNVYSPPPSITLVATLTTTPTIAITTPMTATTKPITTTTLPPPPPQPQQITIDPTLLQQNPNIPQKVSMDVDEIVSNAVNKAMQALLRARFSDLPAVDMKEILQQQMFKDNSYQAHENDKKLYEALQKSLERYYLNQLLADLDEARMKKRQKRNSPRTPFGSPPQHPPAPPPPAGAFVALGTSGASGSSQPPPLPPPSSTERPASPEPAWTIPSSNMTDVENNWATTLASTYVPPAEHSFLAKTEDMTIFLNWYCQQVNTTMEECHKMLIDQVDWTNPEGDQVRVDVNRPLPLSGPPGHVTIQTQFFFNKDLEYLRYGSKGSSLALLISKMKAASYHDFGLKLLVSEHMWIDDVCTYDISAKYGISHWCFNQQKFYIDRLDSSSRQKEVRSHMQILSVVRIKAYSRYCDFEDLNLLLLQGYEFKHDYTIIESHRAVVFSVNNNKQKIMRFIEIYMFSDVTLTKILEALAYRVKEFKKHWRTKPLFMLYTDNRVLIVKPHNKTPYELFKGFKPALSFMRPFGCHVTILNTFDNLGKFDGKSDVGFFVGYSLSSKAFRGNVMHLERKNCQSSSKPSKIAYGKQ